MRNDTRVLFNGYLDQIAAISNVNSATVSFAVDPTVQQRLETRIQESSEFLRRINVIGVDELKGQKVGLGVSGTIARRTNTAAGNRRIPRNVATLDVKGYEAHKTDYDTAIPYALLDAWAKFKDFQARLRNSILQRQALDRLMVGFHGTSAAAATDPVANPLLQDVNIGWLQQYRDNAPKRVMTGGDKPGKVVIGKGAGADYKNLDALVFDAVSSLIAPWHQKNAGLVVILGRNLMHDKFFPLVNKDQPATETLATDLILSAKRVGGLQPAEVPYIADNALMITSLDNLSIYYQITGRRRHVREEPEFDQVANYESSNDAYVVEDYDLGCVVENIEITQE